MLPERCPFITMPALRQRKASLLPSTDANPLRKHMCSEHTSAPANSKAAGAHGPLSSPSGHHMRWATPARQHMLMLYSIHPSPENLCLRTLLS